MRGVVEYEMSQDVRYSVRDDKEYRYLFNTRNFQEVLGYLMSGILEQKFTVTSECVEQYGKWVEVDYYVNLTQDE